MKCPHCNGTGNLEGAEIGTMIHAYRTAKGMTQDELSQCVRKSRAQIANIEAGRTDFPVSMLRAFADALECEPKDLVP